MGTTTVLFPRYAARHFILMQEIPPPFFIPVSGAWRRQKQPLGNISAGKWQWRAPKGKVQSLNVYSSYVRPVPGEDDNGYFSERTTRETTETDFHHKPPPSALSSFRIRILEETVCGKLFSSWRGRWTKNDEQACFQVSIIRRGDEVGAFLIPLFSKSY